VGIAGFYKKEVGETSTEWMTTMRRGKVRGKEPSERPRRVKKRRRRKRERILRGGRKELQGQIGDIKKLTGRERSRENSIGRAASKGVSLASESWKNRGFRCRELSPGDEENHW